MNRPGLTLAALSASILGLAPQGATAQRVPSDTLGAIEGEVRGRLDGEVRPLPFATIQVAAPGLALTALADSTGRYRLSRLPRGAVEVRASHPGHDPLTVEVLVPDRGAVRLDLELRGRPVELDPLDVSGTPGASDPSRRRPPLDAMTVVDVSSLDVSPGVGQPGLLDAVRALPGNDPADPSDVLFMRGSTTDLKLVLLDGAPVYTPFHVAGLMRSFEPGMLGSATLHVGGAPARYDGGLTHILELSTRRPYRSGLRGSGSLDLLTASGALEGPLGPHAGFTASARTLHGLGEPALGGRRPYGYRDVLLGAELEPGADMLVRATGFWNEESVRLDYPQAPDDAWWSNRAAAIAYSGPAGGLRVDATLAASGYGASLPLQPAAVDDSIPDAVLAHAATDQARALLELTRPSPDGALRVGLSAARLEGRYDARVLDGGAYATETFATAEALGGFVDVTRRLSDQVTLRGGVRADAFGGARGIVLAPRAALLWAFDRDALLTVAAGRYHQPARSPDVEVERTLSAVVDNELAASPILPVAAADHVVVSLDQRPSEGVVLTLDGFWKRYEGLFVDPGETVRSSGIDLRLHSAGERGSAWLGYGLSWLWSTRDLSGKAADFSGRHLLTAGLSGRVAGSLGAEARVAYGAGLPYTAIPFSTGRSSIDPDVTGPGEPLIGDGTTQSIDRALDEDFLRLDLELYAHFERGDGERSWEVRPYVRLMNALDRRDALFYVFQPWRDGSLRPLAERPILPVAGIAIRF